MSMFDNLLRYINLRVHQYFIELNPRHYWQIDESNNGIGIRTRTDTQ